MHAIIEEGGAVCLLDPIHLSDSLWQIVTVLDSIPETGLRPDGLAKSEFFIPADFDDPLPDDLMDAFEGR